MPVLAHHHIVGPGDQGQNTQRSLYLQKGDREIARCGPQMEAQKCGEIEPHPVQLARFLSAQAASMSGQTRRIFQPNRWGRITVDMVPNI